MLITREYIMKHRTQKKSWTRSQFKALGISWPPTKGWKKRVIGKEISLENANLFETKLTAKQDRKSFSPNDVLKLQRRLRELEEENKALSNRALDCPLCSADT